MSGNAPAAPAGGSAAPATAAEGNKGCSSCCGGGGDDRPIAPDPTNCERGTTDCLFLLAFLAFWGGMIICAAIGFSSGDPRRLLYFVDYNGNQCGTGVNSANKYAFWGLPLNSGSNICVPKCPGIYTLFTYGNFSSSGNNYGYTVEYNVSTATCALNLAGCVGVSTSNASLAGKTCCTVQNNPAPTGFYVCVPETASTYGVSLLNSTASSYVSTYLSSGNAIFASAISDIMNGWWILLVCVLVSVVIAFLWTYVLKWCAGLFVWSCVILSNLSLMALCGASVYLEVIYKSAYDTSKLSSDQTNYIIFLISAVVTGTAALILLCMTVCLCRQLRIAVGIIQEACMAIQAAPSVLFFPLFQYIILCGFLVYWLVVAVYMASCGTYSKTTAGAYTYTFSDDMMKVIVYHFFGLLWTVSFLRHMTILILAGVFCSYYWTPLSDKNAGNYPASPVLASMWRSVRYHSGTVAFGSFLVAMVQFAQACVEYIRRNYCKEDDRLMQYLACCVQCILACFERCIEYISRNAYIVTAAKGNMFCTAAYEAFKFIFNNIGQVSVVLWVSSYIMILSKLVVVAAVTAICFFITQTESKIASPYILLVLCAIIAYAVASLFLGVVETAIDTILVCFSWEQDAKGNFQNGQVYATDGLNMFIEGIEKAKMDLATKDAAPAALDKTISVDSTPIEAIPK